MSANGDDDQPWKTSDPERLVERGHPAGDNLEAWKWQVLQRNPDGLLVECHLPEHLTNPRGQLFGGYTATYVDFVALHTVHAADPDRDPSAPGTWLTTINLRCDYFEPIMGPTFTVLGEIINQRGLTSLVSTKFFQGDTMAAHGMATLRTLPQETT